MLLSNPLPNIDAIASIFGKGKMANILNCEGYGDVASD